MIKMIFEVTFRKLFFVNFFVTPLSIDPVVLLDCVFVILPSRASIGHLYRSTTSIS